MIMCMFEYVISYCIILIISKITVFCETNKYKIYHSKIKEKIIVFSLVKSIVKKRLQAVSSGFYPASILAVLK